MPDKLCDHTSVGVLVWKEEKVLLIERANFPYGFAPPAGHLDGDPSFEEAARRELREEVGLTADTLELLWEGRKENACRRIDGTWHQWKVYKATVSGELFRNPEETKRVGWYGKAEIDELIRTAKRYEVGGVSDEEWKEFPGMEIVWYHFFRDLDLLRFFEGQ